MRGTALLLMTIRDTDTVQVASGSVLSLGELQDETARELVFQSFLGPLMATEHLEIP